MLYLFPFSDIPLNSRIILYGAETTGYDFYRQIVTSKFCTLVKWVDKQYDWYRSMNLPVDAPESICGEQYDFIVVAAREERTYLGIKKYLLSIGCDESAIYWKDDYKLLPDFVANRDVERSRNDAEKAELIVPISCVTENRMDVVIRVIYAEAFFNNCLSNVEISMYNRVIKAANGFVEPMDNMIVKYFSDYGSKSGMENFHKSFQSLMESMKVNGFKREKFLPLDSQGRLCNGAHRCAAAIALGIRAWGYKYTFAGLNYPYDVSWLAENGFTSDEVEFIHKKYIALKGYDKL